MRSVNLINSTRWSQMWYERISTRIKVYGNSLFFCFFIFLQMKRLLCVIYSNTTLRVLSRTGVKCYPSMSISLLAICNMWRQNWTLHIKLGVCSFSHQIEQVACLLSNVYRHEKPKFIWNSWFDLYRLNTPKILETNLEYV